MENENLELMETTEDLNLIELEPEDEGSGDRFGLGLAIGALVTTAAIAGVKKVKKMIANRKAAKEAEVQVVIEEDLVEEDTVDEVDEEPVKNNKKKK